jgi:hypothetical protein
VSKWIGVIILEGDLLEVVQHLKRAEVWWGNYGSVIQDSKQCPNNFTEWRVEHISRNANRVAHRLAKLALIIFTMR